MTNSEARMTKKARIAKLEWSMLRYLPEIDRFLETRPERFLSHVGGNISSFGFRHTFVIRVSEFVIGTVRFAKLVVHPTAHGFPFFRPRCSCKSLREKFHSAVMIASDCCNRQGFARGSDRCDASVGSGLLIPGNIRACHRRSVRNLRVCLEASNHKARACHVRLSTITR
jgi:hypothetical protein